MNHRGARHEVSAPTTELLDAVIVVVAYNEAEGIGDCLRALLSQDTDQTYEVLVVDDGSTDATSRVVREFQSNDPRLFLVSHDINRGRGAARRTGQDAKSARRIGFVDADIIVPRDWLQRCSLALEEFSAVSGVPLPDGDSAVIWRLFGASIRFRVGFTGITGNNVIFDAEVLRREPFEIQHSLGEDFRLSQRLLRDGYKLKVLEDLRVEHRETKKYGSTVKYMWEMGVDAASHPIKFRISRLADVSWMLWFLWCLLSAVGALFKWWTWTVALTSVVGVSAATNFAYTLSRFQIRPRFLSWIESAFGSFPLIIAYLAGRTWGAAMLVSPRRRRALGM